jgi:hypothetical protein
MSDLSDRLLAVHRALEEAGFPHAFGGAIALAYCTQEPRGTRDLDVNVFVPVDRSGDVLDALPKGVSVAPSDKTAARRNGQVRVMWDQTPIDLFFDTDKFHDEVARSVRVVPFDGTEIPVLGCEALIVFKAMFNRTRDWADIEAVLEAGATNGRGALESVRSILGGSDPAAVRLAGLVERG